MSIDEAYTKYVGQPYKGGKIIGISGRPKLGYADQLYAVVTYPDKPAEHVPVKELKDEPE